MTNNNNNLQTSTQPEGNGTQNTEKTFTQEEVNKIISERLARERAKVEENKNSADAQRAADLTARESRLSCKEYLLDNGYSTELLDCVDTSNVEEFKNKIQKLQSIQKPAHKPRPFIASENASSVVAEAFKNNIKHKPAKY